MIFLAAILTSCQKMEVVQTEYVSPATTGLTRAQETVAYGQLAFDLEVFKKAVASNDENVVVSPFSMAAAWSMVASASAGDTYDEIAGALGFKGCTSEEIGSYYSRSLESMKPANDTCKLFFSNSIWAQYVNQNLSKDFREEVERYYSAEINEIGSDNDKSVKAINDWVKARTNGMLEGIVDQNVIIRTLLLNVIYFESEWLFADCYSTINNYTFTDCRNAKSNRTFFAGIAGNTRCYNLECDSTANNAKEPQILSIPYKACDLEMVFILPPAEERIDEFISSINVNTWNRWMYSLENSPINSNFKIPEFEMESDHDTEFWRSTLSSLGIIRAFDAGDFSKINCSTVTDVLQSARIEVTARGTKAAAASAINMTFGSNGVPATPKYSFIANRPFIYALVEPKTQSILFMGTVVK